MKPNKDKDLEQIVEKAMKASKIEKPSSNFTVDVMSQIEALEFQKSKQTHIVSKTAWFFIIAVSVVLILTSNFLETENQQTYFQNFIELIRVDLRLFNFVPSVNMSNIFIYSILLFGVMFGIQIPLIKYYYSKRIKY